MAQPGLADVRHSIGSRVTRIALSERERILLYEAVERQQPELRPFVDDALRGRVLELGEANALRDAIGSELVATGIDAETGAVNERGELLDRLIDVVAGMSVLHDD